MQICKKYRSPAEKTFSRGVFYLRPQGLTRKFRVKPEKEEVRFLSGVYQGCTTGDPLAAVIYNGDVRSTDYDSLKHKPRPSHGDYTAAVRALGCNDPRGGGHTSGRLTAPRPVVTQPYPGFPTDAQPPLMAACLKAKGTTVFTENIFTNRYRHAEEFRRLGAAVSIEGRVAYVTGVDRLTGAPLTSSDLRGGAAMIVAGLSAEGETEILDNGYINRGYDRFDACLSALGADVRCAAPR